MYTVSAVVLLFGVMLAGCGLTMIMLGLGDARARRIVEGTPVVPLGDWRPGRRLATNAVTDFGAAGRVIAPVSGVVCAWYRAELRRTPPRGQHNEHSEHDLVWWDHAADLPVLHDGTGGILIGEELLQRTANRDDPVATVTTTRTVDDTQPHLMPDFLPENLSKTRLFEGLELVETRLDAGVAVFAIGQAVPHQGQFRLAAARGPLTILTTDTSTTVVERRRKAAESSRSMAKGLLGAGAIMTAIGVLGMVVFVPTG
jgi:hypothetical protein